jgi:uncharacterized protein YeaO (DUF488 family)
MARASLVERLWPRGVAKEKLQIEAWLKDVAPSTELRHTNALALKEYLEAKTRRLAGRVASAAIAKSRRSLKRSNSK